MKRKIVAALAFAGVIGLTTLAFAAGLFPDYPVVGGATYCAGTSSSATGTIIGLVTGCPNQVPAGPTIVTGNEQIPADTRLSGGAAPQTVLIPMASLNALPLTVAPAGLTVGATANGTITATNTTGGFIIVVTAALTGTTTVFLPPAPIDGQQFRLTSNFGLSTIVVTSTNKAATISNSPTALVVSAALPFGYDLMYNAAATTWYRIQ